MSALGFKARVDSLTFVLHRLHETDSSDLPLVRHLPISWQFYKNSKVQNGFPKFSGSVGRLLVLMSHRGGYYHGPVLQGTSITLHIKELKFR